MTNQIMINELKQIGLAEYEAKCYLALFERKSLTVSEISKLTGIARPNTYDAMEKLSARGLIVSMPGGTKKYAVSAPQMLVDKSLEILEANSKAEIEALERKRRELLELKLNEIAEKKRIMRESVTKIVDELNCFYEANKGNDDPLDYFEILRNPLQIHNKYVKLIAEAKYEILGFVKPPFSFSTGSQEKEQDSAGENAVFQGAHVRGIHELPEDKSELAAYFEGLNATINPDAEEVKVIEKLPLKLFIFDGKISMFTLQDPIQGKLSLTMFVVDHPVLAESFKLLFNSYWEKAQYQYVHDGHKYSVKLPNKRV